MNADEGCNDRESFFILQLENSFERFEFASDRKGEGEIGKFASNKNIAREMSENEVLAQAVIYSLTFLCFH